MTKTEQKVFDYAQSVEWDYDKVKDYIGLRLYYIEFKQLDGVSSFNKTDIFIQKHKPKDWREGVQELKEYTPLTITIPIEDYNRLRKLEIKKQIKKLKKELKGL